jgi:hypothetical protein
MLIYIQIGQHRTSRENSAKKALAKFSCTSTFGERFADKGNHCAFKSTDRFARS